jgi:2-haloacid dehalogenase
MARDTILFDINETVLDLGSLKPKFKAAFGGESVTATWFSMLLHTSTVCALTATKSDFATLAGTMLDAISARLNVALAEGTRADILNGFACLPAHADIQSALTRLRSAGFRTVAFTNSSLNLVTTQINNAGLTEYFDDIVSVEATGSFKPDPMVYAFVAERVNRPIGDLRLVAAHDWDTHGAITAGMHAAYIDRTGVPYHPLYRQPDICATNMGDIVGKIMERERS